MSGFAVAGTPASIGAMPAAVVVGAVTIVVVACTADVGEQAMTASSAATTGIRMRHSRERHRAGTRNESASGAFVAAASVTPPSRKPAGTTAMRVRPRIILTILLRP